MKLLGVVTSAKLLGVAALLCVGVAGVASAATIGIDPSIFSFESSPGVASWTGNSLTLNFSGTGGYSQTTLLPTSLLPANIIGISFDISSSLSNERISFSYIAYDATGHHQGDIILVNYLFLPTDTGNLTTFSSIISGLGRNTSVETVEFLGSNYSPLSLNGSNHDGLSTYPLFRLDFRADGYDGTNYFPGAVTFASINWITGPSSVPGPIVGAGLPGLLAAGAAFVAWKRRRHVPQPQT